MPANRRLLPLALPLLLAGCAGSDSAPSAPVVGAAPTAAGPAAPSGWDQVVAAARREGQLVIYGSVGEDLRTSLTSGFKQRYPDIQVDFEASSANELAVKVQTERKAGKFASDLYIHGSQTAVNILMPAGIIVPIDASLVGPEAADVSSWTGGKLAYSDDAGKFNLVFLSAAKLPLAYNPSLIAAGEIKSYKDLLDPKWKGKISIFDPRAGNTGIGMTTFFFMLPEFGQDFLAKLFNSGVVLTRDDSQQIDWIARGQYPLSIGPTDHIFVEQQAKGLQLAAVPPENIREGTYLTSASGNLSVFDKAPHPNAAKVYVDWLLSKAAQTDISKATGYPSRRTDVPTDQIASFALPKPGGRYLENYKESFIHAQADVQKLVATMIRD